MTEGPTTQSFFQGDNKTYFISSKNTETCYDVQKVLEQFLKEEGEITIGIMLLSRSSGACQ